MRTRSLLPLIGLLLGLGGPAVAIEQPRYEVLASDGDVELRRYSPYMVAETFIGADFRNAGNEGFGRLFRYITGANSARAEISMTAPVSQQAGGVEIAMTAPVGMAEDGNGHWVSFVVPSAFTPETVPQPTDPRVRIREIPAQLVAAVRYSGFWGEGRYAREERRLRDAMAARGLVAGGAPLFARYDPPYMPPFMRRNEILIPVAEGVAGAWGGAGPVQLSDAQTPAATTR